MCITRTIAAVVLTAAFGLGGCGESTVTESTPQAVAVPASYFAGAAPAGAVPLVTAKNGAKAGDQVTFEGRIGGRRQPFVENRAVFFVADSSLPSCDELEGDTCKYPWDYCCEPRERLRAHLATVQIVDAAGQPLKTSLLDQHGLAPAKTVVVTGTVAEIDEAGNFVVNAQRIHVAG